MNFFLLCRYLSKALGSLLLLFAGAAGAANLTVAVQGVQQSEARAAVNVLVLNTDAQPAAVSLPSELPARLMSEQRSWPVQLRSDESAQNLLIQPGQFVTKRYSFEVPTGATGRLVVEIEQPASARGVIEVPNPETAAANVAAEAVQPPTVSLIERSFASRFAFHEPIYFVYGAKTPAAKFQFSFKYRLLGADSAFSEAAPASRGFYLAYSQRSLWDVAAESSPFYDTSYMPELFFEWLAPNYAQDRARDRGGWFHWLGFQTGLQHESNGRDGDDSRSLNIAYARSGLALGDLEGWRLIVAPRIFAYIGDSSDNADIARYRGYNDVQIIFGKNAGMQIGVTTRIGKLGDKGSIQVDLTHPVRVPLIGLKTYFDVQYFSGYGESLRRYNEKTSVWRAGIAFVR